MYLKDTGAGEWFTAKAHSKEIPHQFRRFDERGWWKQPQIYQFFAHHSARLTNRNAAGLCIMVRILKKLGSKTAFRVQKMRLTTTEFTVDMIEYLTREIQQTRYARKRR